MIEKDEKIRKKGKDDKNDFGFSGFRHFFRKYECLFSARVSKHGSVCRERYRDIKNETLSKDDLKSNFLNSSSSIKRVDELYYEIKKSISMIKKSLKEEEKP